MAFDAHKGQTSRNPSLLGNFPSHEVEHKTNEVVAQECPGGNTSFILISEMLASCHPALSFLKTPPPSYVICWISVF